MRRLFQFRPLRIRLIQVLIGLVLLSILGTSLIQTVAGILTQKKTLTTMTLNSNYTQAVKLSETMNTLLREMQSSLETASHTIARRGGSHRQPSLDLLLNSTHMFNAVFFVNAAGVIDAIAPASLGLRGSKMDSDEGRIALALQRPYISSPHVDLNNRLIMMVTYPVFDRNGQYLGFVGGSINLRDDNALTRIFGRQVRTPNGSYYYVVDNRGILIYHPSISRIGEDVSRNPIVRKLLSGGSGYGEVINTQNIPFLAGYASVGMNSWGIVVQTPQSFIQGSSALILRNQAMYSLPFVLLLLLLTLVVAKRLSLPFTALTETSRRIAGGERVDELPGPSKWNYEAFHLNRAVTLAVQGLQRQADHYSAEARIDSLTGLMNRRTFMDCTQALVNGGIPFSVIVLDLDHFKSINDSYGHQVGDEVLKYAASVLTEGIRAGEICCRYGGEEFVVLLPRASTDQAYGVAERIRGHLEQTLSPVGRPVTASIGIAQFPVHGLDFEEAFYCADLALYEAKKNGRNRTVIARGRQGNPDAHA